MKIVQNNHRFQKSSYYNKGEVWSLKAFKEVIIAGGPRESGLTQQNLVLYECPKITVVMLWPFPGDENVGAWIQSFSYLLFVSINAGFLFSPPCSHLTFLLSLFVILLQFLIFASTFFLIWDVIGPIWVITMLKHTKWNSWLFPFYFSGVGEVSKRIFKMVFHYFKVYY